MKIALNVHYADGTTREVVAKFADFVAFERTWQRSVARFESDVRLTDLAWLAWHVEHREKRTALKFDPDWVATVEEIETSEDTAADGDTSVPSVTTPRTG